jgi:hypothetical protein
MAWPHNREWLFARWRTHHALAYGFKDLGAAEVGNEQTEDVALGLGFGSTCVPEPARRDTKPCCISSLTALATVIRDAW